MIKVCIGTSLLILLINNFIFSQDIKATTDDGRRVLLKEDGTWSFIEKKESNVAGALFYSRPEKSTKVLKTRMEGVQLWYNPAMWIQKNTANPAVVNFDHKEGKVTASLAVEEPGISEGPLKEIALRSAREVSPDIRVLYDESKRLNGKQLLCMKMEGTIQNIPFLFYGYYYIGENGVVKFLTYALDSLFPEYETDMLDLLNGLSITEEE